MTIKAGQYSDQLLESWYYFGFYLMDYQTGFLEKNI